MKNFDLHLNDIKFSDAAPSNDYLHFSKFSDATFFNVFFGLEEVEALLQRAQNEDQVENLYGKLAQLFEQNPISLQRVTIQRHFSTEGKVSLFLESLNPNPPTNPHALRAQQNMKDIFTLFIELDWLCIKFDPATIYCG